MPAPHVLSVAFTGSVDETEIVLGGRGDGKGVVDVDCLLVPKVKFDAGGGVFVRVSSTELCLDNCESTDGISDFDISTALFERLEGSSIEESALRFEVELAFR